ncbi:interferon-induced protein with tetratricopeptide repeats 5-like [Hemitrygon akajei]|uniref:interferon-induced protein with tetratricopeptide repeats 5-like n=1 Tax=Hemitrygon akajei TaxID=2704970 RepID=UPI003BF9EA48
MSNTPRDSLKEKLSQLQCHFTWSPKKETLDLEDFMYRLEDSLQFAVKYQGTSYNQLAFVNCLQGNHEEAIKNLKEAEKILREEYKDEFERRCIVTYGNFAWVHYHMGQLTEAQSYLDKLEIICKPLSDGPRYTAMIPEVYGEKGWSLLKSAAEYYEEAKECFAKALEQDPDNTEWIMGYATVLSRLESFSGTTNYHEQSQSVKYLRRVLELDPDHSLAMVMLAIKLQKFNVRKEANELVEQALKKTPDVPYVLRYVAKFYRLEGAVDKAINLLKRILEFTPNSCFVHHQLGICYRSKLPRTARPYHTDCYNDALQHKTELIEQCIYHFEKASEYRKRTAVQPQLDLADIYVKIGDIPRADKIYSFLQKLKDIPPENMQNICLHAGLFELYHRSSEANAISLFLKGLKIEYNSSERKKCHFQLEKWADRKLCRNPHDSKALGIKGLLFQQSGNKAKAIEYFEKALETDHDNEDYLSALWELRLSLKGQNDA